MSEWITDREPTEADAGPSGLVWATYEGKVDQYNYDGVFEGTPWMPVIVPEPYVKAKRWTAKWNAGYERWLLVDTRYKYGWIRLPYLDREHSDQHREAAERIAEIYEEMLP